MRAAAVLVVLLLGGCSSSGGAAAPDDAGAESGFGRPDSSGAAHLDGGAVDTSPPARVTSHAGRVLAAPHVFAVYLSGARPDGGTTVAPSEDASLTWLLGSAGYWGRLAQYGVLSGTFLGSAAVPLDAVVPPSKVSSGVVGQKDFADGVARFLHPSSGVDAGAAIPPADAYAFFLPDGVNVVFPANQGTTCLTAAAYHDDDGIEPFAVFPPCGAGRDDKALGHELVEVATDPFGTGSYSDADYANGGGEISDLCDQPVTVDGHAVATFWSDSAAGCVP